MSTHTMQSTTPTLIDMTCTTGTYTIFRGMASSRIRTHTGTKPWFTNTFISQTSIIGTVTVDDSATARHQANDVARHSPSVMGSWPARLWRWLCQPAASALPHRRRADTVSGGRSGDRDLAGIRCAYVAGRAARLPLSLSHTVAGGHGAHDRNRAWLCRRQRVLAIAGYRRDRHAQPIEWRRQYFSAARTSSTRSTCYRWAAHRSLRSLQSRRRTIWRFRGVVCRRFCQLTAET